MISQKDAQKYLRLAVNFVPWSLMLFFFIFSLDSRSILELLMHNLPTIVIGLAWSLSVYGRHPWLVVVLFAGIGLFFNVFFQGWIGLYLGAICLTESAIIVLLQRAQK